MPKVGTVWTFDYTGTEQTLTIPATGTYKLETWGAQGGSFSNEKYGGYGGYSAGKLKLNIKDIIYVVVGQNGRKADSSNTLILQSYNGGGMGRAMGGSGGGATHIAKNDGLLSTLEKNKSDILIVSGGGGGAAAFNYKGIIGGAGGGFTGSSGLYNNGTPMVTGGNQLQGGQTFKGSFSTGSSGKTGNFGAGGTAGYEYINSRNEGSGAGGGGWYGGAGGSARDASGSGGSGYIGNTTLYDKIMYCYNCEESSEESTKTISTTCTSETPTENCSKQGNGYARITLISY